MENQRVEWENVRAGIAQWFGHFPRHRPLCEEKSLSTILRENTTYSTTPSRLHELYRHHAPEVVAGVLLFISSRSFFLEVS